MVSELPIHGPLTREDERAHRIYYIIYDADVRANEEFLLNAGNMDPNRAVPGVWTQTEGDEQYDYGYLADEGAGEDYRNGHHRKWVGELNHEQFLALAQDRCWDLDEDERPINCENTGGSITEYGHLPAYCITDHEGWADFTTVGPIWASFYISEGCLPMGARSDLTTNEGT